MLILCDMVKVFIISFKHSHASLMQDLMVGYAEETNV